MSDEDRLLHHEYDGIQEYDNPLPGWWSGIFIATIVFSIAYWFWYHGGGPGRSETQQFESAWARHEAWRAEAEKKATIVVDDAALARMAKDPAALDAGARLFAQNCVGCHQADGGGSVGPNLTDDHQIHGRGRMDLYKTIRDGVPAKGMVAWGATMGPRELAQVTAYVASLRGKPVAGKAPEGAKIPPYTP